MTQSLLRNNRRVMSLVRMQRGPALNVRRQHYVGEVCRMRIPEVEWQPLARVHCCPLDGGRTSRSLPRGERVSRDRWYRAGCR